jgi:3-methylcrotonyl-CoA carboxylase alpha subunit
MFSSVLIANRSEIACRIARTAKALGMRTVAVHSEVDAHALHVRSCDESYAIGPAPPSQSYLRIEKIIEVARRAGVECVHPGYGFLAERAEFAEACAEAGIVFIGPPPSAIRAMGLKNSAKMLMTRAGVPVIPGYSGDNQQPKFLKEKADELGYPILIKAVAGGGGKGMRRVNRHSDFDAAFDAAQREALSAFGDSRVMIEKYIAQPRHIEMQIFADRYGNAIHLFERDCSLQRRHQKVIEEAPAPGLSNSMRETMGLMALEVARTVNYVGAGTVEFIADASEGLRADRFWFLEMNTRLQVEHPVTEAITGLDLVELQFRVSAGETLPVTQAELRLDGHAVEARLYAEEPERGFLPSTGRLIGLRLPEGNGMRVDAGVEEGDQITPFYDSLIAKIIARGATRREALDKLANALERTLAAGPRTNLAFLIRISRDSCFRRAEFDTDFIERNLAALGAVPQALDAASAAAGVARLLQREQARLTGSQEASATVPTPWRLNDAFQFNGGRHISLPVLADGHKTMAVVNFSEADVDVSVDGVYPAHDVLTCDAPDAVHVLRKGRQTVVGLKLLESDIEHGFLDGLVRAPMHGKVLAILVMLGETVAKGQRLAIIEAMKMEHSIHAPLAGTVVEIAAREGGQIAEGGRLIVIEPTEIGE